MAVSATPGVAVAAVVIAVAASGVPIAASIIAVVTPGIAVSATAVVAAAVPRAGADEDATDKVVRTVKAIWGAVVRVVVVVSVRANRSYADVAVARADSNVKGNLSLCVACTEHEKAE